MTNYEFNPDFDSPQNTHHIQIEFAPAEGTVLDVGCNTGQFGAELMRRKNVKVIGAEHDTEAAVIARTRLTDVIEVNLEDPQWTSIVKEHCTAQFAAIIFGDVLEHTTDPQRILLDAKQLLKHDGVVIVSIPNVAYWRVRLGLFFGRFDYADSGILDRTHLRFFTRRSSRTLLESAGYRIIGSETAAYDMPHWLIRTFPTLFGVQFVYKAIPLHRDNEET